MRRIATYTKKTDLFVLSAGFEDRAFEILRKGEFHREAHCILVEFKNGVEGNKEIFRRYHSLALEKFSDERVHIVPLHGAAPSRFESDLSNQISLLPRYLRLIGVDVSGLPAYAICSALKVVRDHRPEEKQRVFYTAAQNYNPSHEAYLELEKNGQEEIELLPQSMALEMSENLILETFSGYRSQNAKSFLALFAGFEAHRATGVIEAVNPSLLLLIYGQPANDGLDWRLTLSRKLHAKFERGRRTATEVVSTLQLKESLNIIEGW